MPEHAEFIDTPGYEAPNEDETVWRYMNLDRFVSMLSTKSLWFSSRQQLVRTDPFEGIEYPLMTIEDALSNVVKYINEEGGIRQLRGVEILRAGAMTPAQIEQLRLDRNEIAPMSEAALSCSIAVNCWHCSTDESAAMWKIYAGSGSDIAVRSTARLLRSSLRPKSSQTIRIARVNYDDAPAKDRTKLAFDSMLWKRRAYRYEQEVRALLWKTDDFAAESRRQYDHFVATKRLEPAQPLKALDPPMFLGEKIEVDLSVLIQEIVVSPQIRSWQLDAVQSVLEAFRMQDVTVRPSTLADP